MEKLISHPIFIVTAAFFRYTIKNATGQQKEGAAMSRKNSLILAEIKKREQYFKKDSKEIAAANLRLLLGSSGAALLILILCLFLSPSLLQGWSPTFYHLLFLPSTVLLCIFSFHYYRKESVSAVESIILCVIFETVIFSFVILIDCISSPTAPAVFMPIMCVAIPALFVMPFTLTFLLLCIYELIFIACVLTFKVPWVGQYDIFSSVTALGCSVIVINLILFLRVRDFETRMKYKLLSIHDALSNVLNKQASTEAILQFLNAQNGPVNCALLMMDLDDFKSINDTRGHYMGDQVLKCFGNILLQTFRSTDVIGRFGGDEFLVFLKGGCTPELLEEKCRAVQQQLAKQVQENYGFKAGCSIGAICLIEQEISFEELFREADMALYQAKGTGKGCFPIRSFQGVSSQQSGEP